MTLKVSSSVWLTRVSLYPTEEYINLKDQESHDPRPIRLPQQCVTQFYSRTLFAFQATVEEEDMMTEVDMTVTRPRLRRLFTLRIGMVG